MNRTFDASLAVGGMSSPWWMTYLEDPLATAVVFAGLFLLILRCILTWREIRRGRKK